MVYESVDVDGHFPSTITPKPKAADVNTIEMLAMGSEMRRQAEARCPSVNDAHFMVHEVMLETLTDPAVTRGRMAHASLLARLDTKLSASEVARANRLVDVRTTVRID